MGAQTKIQWTESTWNPIRAKTHAGKVGWYCERVSEGCRNCYSDAMNRRLGTGFDYKPGHRRKVQLFLDEKLLTLPLGWRSRPRTIFVCSMTDLFGDFVNPDWVNSMFRVMATCSMHAFQVLTKRPSNARAYFASPPPDWPFMEWPPENIWLGVSAEDQETWNERVPILMDANAANKFVSAEPLIGPIDAFSGAFPDWLIVGGESGAEARICRSTWIADLIAASRARHSPIFVKQMGAQFWRDYEFATGAMPQSSRVKFRDAKGGDMSEWPEEFQIREMPR